MKAGYTLLEIMVACAVVAILVAVAVPATTRISEYSARTKSLANLRQIGMAARLYANDHNQVLPGQPRQALPRDSDAAERWPGLFCTYLTPSNPAIFVDPSDPEARKLALSDVLSNRRNNTGFVYNGFDEFATDSQPPTVVPLYRLSDQPNVVLLAQKKRGATAFYVSPVFQPIVNLLDILNPGAYEGGSHYLFVDGSVRYLKWNEYSNSFWLVDKTASLPLPPLPVFPQDGPDPDAGMDAPNRRMATGP